MWIEQEKENQCALLEVVGLWKNFFFILFGCMLILVTQ